MGMVAGIGSLLSGGLGVASGLSGLFGGGGAGSVPIPGGQPVNLGGITSQLNQDIPQLSGYNLGGQNYNQYAGLLQNAINNPYGGQAVNMAEAFGPLGGLVGGQGVGNALSLGGTVNPLIQQSFDPQSALYNRTADQTSQQTLAALGGSGLANTPYGQAAYGGTMGNFNIDWQNQQLQRMLAGVAGAGGAANNAAQLGFGAIQGADTAGLTPFNTYGQVSQAPLNLLSGGAQYGQQAAAIPQMGIGDWLQYLSGANSANNVANNSALLALQQQQQQFNQNQIFGHEIGAGLGSMFGGFGGGGFGGGGFGGFSNPSFGGGSFFGGDAYGGSSSNPLPGLTAADYGAGF